MSFCPGCYRSAEEGSEHCTRCGAERPATGWADDPLLGRVIRDVYQVTERVGEGGMGCVYRAQHTTLKKDVAVKFLFRDLSTPLHKKRFEREARTAAQLQGPHTVHVHHFGRLDDGVLYQIMEYVPGGSLADWIDTGERFAWQHVLAILEQVAVALAEGHEKGTLHRDVKPDNILVVPSRRGLFLKLTDFGIASIAQNEDGSPVTKLTETGLIFGSPGYMSPEQARGAANLDARSDLYSLGVVAYELLAGRRLFDAKTPMERLVKHATEMPTPLGRLEPQLNAPQTLCDIIESMVARDPADRFANADALLAALGAIDPAGEGATAIPSVTAAPQHSPTPAGETLNIRAMHREPGPGYYPVEGWQAGSAAVEGVEDPIAPRHDPVGASWPTQAVSSVAYERTVAASEGRALSERVAEHESPYLDATGEDFGAGDGIDPSARTRNRNAWLLLSPIALPFGVVALVGGYLAVQLFDGGGDAGTTSSGPASAGKTAAPGGPGQGAKAAGHMGKSPGLAAPAAGSAAAMGDSSAMDNGAAMDDGMAAGEGMAMGDDMAMGGKMQTVPLTPGQCPKAAGGMMDMRMYRAQTIAAKDDHCPNPSHHVDGKHGVIGCHYGSVFYLRSERGHRTCFERAQAVEGRLNDALKGVGAGGAWLEVGRAGRSPAIYMKYADARKPILVVTVTQQDLGGYRTRSRLMGCKDLPDRRRLALWWAALLTDHFRVMTLGQPPLKTLNTPAGAVLEQMYEAARVVCPGERPIPMVVFNAITAKLARPKLHDLVGASYAVPCGWDPDRLPGHGR